MSLMAHLSFFFQSLFTSSIPIQANYQASSCIYEVRKYRLWFEVGLSSRKKIPTSCYSHERLKEVGALLRIAHSPNFDLISGQDNVMCGVIFFFFFWDLQGLGLIASWCLYDRDILCIPKCELYIGINT